MLVVQLALEAFRHLVDVAEALRHQPLAGAQPAASAHTAPPSRTRRTSRTKSGFTVQSGSSIQGTWMAPTGCPTMRNSISERTSMSTARGSSASSRWASTGWRVLTDSGMGNPPGTGRDQPT